MVDFVDFVLVTNSVVVISVVVDSVEVISVVSNSVVVAVVGEFRWIGDFVVLITDFFEELSGDLEVFGKISASGVLAVFFCVGVVLSANFLVVFVMIVLEIATSSRIAILSPEQWRKLCET